MFLCAAPPDTHWRRSWRSGAGAQQHSAPLCVSGQVCSDSSHSLRVRVRHRVPVSQENAESCKSDVSPRGGGPGGRFHLSHIAPWSTWLLLASPISLPFVRVCARRSPCLRTHRGFGENEPQSHAGRTLAAHIPTSSQGRETTCVCNYVCGESEELIPERRWTEERSYSRSGAPRVSGPRNESHCTKLEPFNK